MPRSYWLGAQGPAPLRVSWASSSRLFSGQRMRGQLRGGGMGRRSPLSLVPGSSSGARMGPVCRVMAIL